MLLPVFHVMRIEDLTEVLRALVLELMMSFVRAISILTTHHNSVQVYNTAAMCDVTLINDVQNVLWDVLSAMVLKILTASLAPMTHYFVIQPIN